MKRHPGAAQSRDRLTRVVLDPDNDPGSALRVVRDDGSMMTEVLFYHLQHQPLEAVLPTLLQKTLERGWRAVVQVTTEERMSSLDDHLWTFTDESFLPHGTDREAHAADQPILITLSGGNPNGASIRFLVEGADLPDDMAAYQRLAILFDGNDIQALAFARDQWRAVKEGGHDATYWQQDESGRWQRKA